MIRPALASEACSSAWRGRLGNWRAIASVTRSASLEEGVTRMAGESGPCSA